MKRRIGAGDPLLLAILAALAVAGCGEEDEKLDAVRACTSVPEGTTTCKPAKDLTLDEFHIPWDCSHELVAVHGDGTVEKHSGQDAVEYSACCYDADALKGEECIIGRPYTEDGAALMSEVLATSATTSVGGCWQDNPRAKAWADAGAAEHASVAAFSRLSLQLMALGAPLDLLQDVHSAALDEVRHAQSCWGLVAHLGGPSVAAGAFPFSQPVELGISLENLAAQAVTEGCVNETLGAYAARELAQTSNDPAVREVFDLLARDEARHAALSYRIVAWALRVGGESVRSAVIDALRAEPAKLDCVELALRAGIAPAFTRDLNAAALTQVVHPALRELLAA